MGKIGEQSQKKIPERPHQGQERVWARKKTHAGLPPWKKGRRRKCFVWVSGFGKRLHKENELNRCKNSRRKDQRRAPKEKGREGGGTLMTKKVERGGTCGMDQSEVENKEKKELGPGVLEEKRHRKLGKTLREGRKEGTSKRKGNQEESRLKGKAPGEGTS